MSPEQLTQSTEDPPKAELTMKLVEANIEKRAKKARKKRNRITRKERDLRAKASGGQLFETPLEIMRDLGQ